MTRLAWDVTFWGIEFLVWMTYRSWFPHSLRKPTPRHRKEI